MRHRGWILPLALLSAMVGCAPKAQQLEHRGIPNDGRFEDRKNKFAIEYPDGWTERKPTSAEDVVVLKHKDYQGEISIAVPKLPPHIPGIIPLPSVEKGYIDDVKKRLKDVQVTESRPLKIDGQFARRCAMTGVAPEGKQTIAALALVKGDTLYIMSAESPLSEAEDVRD